VTDCDLKLLEAEYRLTLAELCRSCGVQAEKVLLLVEEGVIEPAGKSPTDWSFPPADLQRARCALRLERDLGINGPGAALVVDLLDEMQHLRKRIDLLEGLVFHD
jgi:chaperone modulatory protein CbpM